MMRVPRTEIQRYVVAVLTVALASILSLAVQPLIPTLRFPLFYVAVAFSAWFGGLEPGLLATVLSAIAAVLLLVLPGESFQISLSGLIQVSLFVLVSTIISLLSGHRKKAEETATHQRESMRTTLSSIGDGVVVTDTSGRVSFLNPVAEQMTGWTQMEAFEKPVGAIFRIINEQTRQRAENPIDRVMREGVVLGLANHTLLIAKDGTERPIDDSGAPIRDSDGTVVGAILVFRDITERRRAENRVRESEAGFRRLIDSAPGGILAIDETGRIEFVNARVESMFGYRRDELLGQPVEMLMPERFGGAHANYRTGYFGAPSVRPMGKGRELIGRRKDGSEFPVEIGLSYSQTDKGLQSLAFMLDITERRRAEEAVRRQADLLEQAHDAIFVWEFGGRITQWYRGAEMLYGWSRKEAVGHSAEQLLHTVSPIPRVEIEGILQTTGAWEGELIHTTKDGRQVTVESRFVLVQYEDSPRLVLEVNRDITERKQAEFALEHERSLLRTLIDTAPDYIYVRDTEGRFIINNAEHRRVLGAASLADVVGKTDFDFFPAELAARYSADDQEVVQSGQPLINREEPTSDPAGHKEWVLTTKVPLRDREGKVIGLVGISRDITERKREADTQRFLSEASTTLASSLDYQTTLVSVARLAVPTIADWCAVHVVPEDGTIKQLAVEHVDPQKVKWAYELQRRYPPDPNARTGLYRVIRSGQPEFYPEITAETLAAAIQDPEILQIARDIGFTSAMTVPLTARGQILGAIQFVLAESGRHYGPSDLAMAQDLARRAAVAIDNARLYATAQQAREVAEKAAERVTRLQRITAALSEALTPSQVSAVILTQGLPAVGAAAGSIVLLTGGNTTLEITDAAGYSSEVIQTWTRFSVDTPIPIAEVVRTGQPIWIESRAERDQRYPDLTAGAEGYNAWAAIPMTIEKRILGGLTLSFAEERTFTEEDRTFILALAQQSAQAVERARLYAESQASAEVLRERVEERTRELQEALVQAQSADRAKGALLATVSHEMRTPLSSIVGFSNLILNRKPQPEKTLEYASFINAEARRLATLINDFLDLQRIEAGREVFRFQDTDLADLIRDVAGKQQLGENSAHKIRLDLEPMPQVHVDADRIRQVVLNLLSNALKYSSGGEIVISLRTSDGSVICSVRDRGLGIPAEELGRVFERFYRGNVAERLRIRGTGLGLALCREIIQAHGGYIWAESPGAEQGSTFSFSLPVAQSPSVFQYEMGTASAQATTRRIVVVEDDEHFAAYLSERLEPEGYIVDVRSFNAATPDDIADLDPDLIVLDLLEGDGQPGWGVLSALKQNRATRNIPVLVCSVLREPERAWRLGASAYVAKPVDEAFLLKEITRLIGPPPRTVLVVDDSDAVRTLLQDTLGEAGYRIELAENGQAAIDRLQNGWPDLIVLDLLMPNVDGFDVLDWIRNQRGNREVPVIVFTAAELTREERQVLSEEANALAVKADTSPQQLLDLIRTMLIAEK